MENKYKNKEHHEQESILVVDDETESLTILCDILSEWGYKVAGFTTGKESLEALKKQSFDLMISDLAMPAMDGIALLKESRELDPNLICIIMTGHGTIKTAVEAMKVGAFDFIEKPIDFRVLKYVITRASEVRQLYKLKEIYHSIVEDYQTEFIFRFLPDMTLTFVNDTFCRWLERTKEQLMGQSFMQFVFKEDKEYVNHVISTIHKDNPIVIIEYRLVKHSGKICWQRLIIRGMFDKNGNLKENQAIGYDITEQKQTEESLRESEQKLKKIIEHSNEIFYIHDNQHRITYISPNCMQILGYTSDEMMTEWIEFITDNPINRLGVEITEKALKTGERQNPYLLELYRKDKTKVILEIDESPLKDEKGNVIGIVGAARDVTERKKAEEEIKKRVKELEEFYDIAVGRELRMKELKEQIEELTEKLSKYGKND